MASFKIIHYNLVSNECLCDTVTVMCPVPVIWGGNPLYYFFFYFFNNFFNHSASIWPILSNKAIDFTWVWLKSVIGSIYDIF